MYRRGAYRIRRLLWAFARLSGFRATHSHNNMRDSDFPPGTDIAKCLNAWSTGHEATACEANAHERCSYPAVSPSLDPPRISELSKANAGAARMPECLRPAALAMLI